MDRPGSGLRRLIGLLLVLNLGVFVAGWGGTMLQGKGAPPVAFNAEKIQLLEDVLPEQKSGSAAEAAGSGGLVVSETCPAWSGLDADGVAQVQVHLRQLGVADADYDLMVEMRLGWWVFIPPLENAAALRVVMDDALAKGIKDMAPVRVGDMAGALSLGVFPGLDGARRRAQEVTQKGIRGVRYGPRPGAGRLRLAVVQDSPRLRHALKAAWPVGLAPDACKAE